MGEQRTGDPKAVSACPGCGATDRQTLWRLTAHLRWCSSCGTLDVDGEWHCPVPVGGSATLAKRVREQIVCTHDGAIFDSFPPQCGTCGAWLGEVPK